MLTAALPLPVAPVAPAAPATPAPDTSGTTGSEPGAFARELQSQQTRGEEPAARGEGRTKGKDDSSTDVDEEKDADDQASATPARGVREWMLHPLRRDTATTPAGAAGPGANAALDTDSAVDPEAADAKADKPTDASGAPSPDPALLAAWLQAPRTPAAPPPGGSARAAAEPAQDTRTEPLAALAATTPAEGTPPPGAAGHAERPDRRLHGAVEGADGRAGGPRPAARGGAEGAPAEIAATAAANAPARPAEAAAAVPATQPLPTFAAELQRAAQALQPDAAAPAPREVALASPVTAPEFVPSLSAEVALLARDGVQEARLQLNPAELGPVAVRITVDGDRAQVHLAVDHATTLQVLDQALPTLAAALRDQGLTLSGGGVFQQARQNARDEGNPGANAPWMRGRTGADEPAVEPVAVRRVAHRGGLDVYA